MFSWFKKENDKLNIEYKGCGVFIIPVNERKEFTKIYNMFQQAQKDMKGKCSQ